MSTPANSYEVLGNQAWRAIYDATVQLPIQYRGIDGSDIKCHTVTTNEFPRIGIIATAFGLERPLGLSFGCDEVLPGIKHNGEISLAVTGTWVDLLYDNSSLYFSVNKASDGSIDSGKIRDQRNNYAQSLETRYTSEPDHSVSQFMHLMMGEPTPPQIETLPTPPMPDLRPIHVSDDELQEMTKQQDTEFIDWIKAMELTPLVANEFRMIIAMMAAIRPTQ